MKINKVQSNHNNLAEEKLTAAWELAKTVYLALQLSIFSYALFLPLSTSIRDIVFSQLQLGFLSERIGHMLFWPLWLTAIFALIFKYAYGWTLAFRVAAKTLNIKYDKNEKVLCCNGICLIRDLSDNDREYAIIPIETLGRNKASV